MPRRSAGDHGKRGIGPEQLALGLDAVRLLVEEVPAEVTDPMRPMALQRIDRRDPDDWPIAAAALILDCPIWTEDRDFFSAGIPTWKESPRGWSQDRPGQRMPRR
ncbi:PIN domain-containing protein [Microbacterium sp.]|uniref:PIN domain-containing protein n=1 Tax=Microbacterium sp. TaxID=51671 RepID=UPI003C7699B3